MFVPSRPVLDPDSEALVQTEMDLFDLEKLADRFRVRALDREQRHALSALAAELDQIAQRPLETMQ